MTVKEFIEINGLSPELERGDWIPWQREGTYELTSLNNLHVWPAIWCIASGLVYVLTYDKQVKLVREENLKRYKPISRASEKVKKAPKVKKPGTLKIDADALMKEILTLSGVE